MWNVKEGVEGGWRGGLTASHSYSSFVGERFFCIGSRVGDGAIAQLFIQVSLLQTNMCSLYVWLDFGAVTACQHSEGAVINHHTFDQNAANLYCFL